MPERQREQRKPVQIGVRLKDDAGWCDAQIRNISSRGIMALIENPPGRGSYVEIRRGPYVMIGRVAWSGADRIGIHVRERIVLEDLLVPVAPGRKALRSGDDCQLRVRRKPTPEELAAASIRFSRVFDFAAVAIVTIGLAVTASSLVAEAFSEPLEQAELALRGNGRG